MNLQDKVKITADSCVDLDTQKLEDNNISVAFLSTIDNTTNKIYKDGELSNEELFSLFEQGHKITTSCPSYFEYTELFKKYLKEYEKIVHYNISSELSGSYELAKAASEEIDPKRIEVIDTKQPSLGIAINVLNAVQYLKEMSNFNKFIETTKSEVSRTELTVILDTAKYVFLGGRLQKILGPSIGGRLDKTAEYGTNIAEKFNIRYFVDIEEGKIVMKKIAKGNTLKLATHHFKAILDDIKNIDLKRIMFGTTGDINNLDKIVKAIPITDQMDNIDYAEIGPTVATHGGPKALALSYIKKL